LAYAILQESYEERPDELNKWLETTKIVQPRPRMNMLKSKVKSSPSYPVISKSKEVNPKTTMSHEYVKPTVREEDPVDKPLNEEDETKSLYHKSSSPNAPNTQPQEQIPENGGFEQKEAQNFAHVQPSPVNIPQMGSKVSILQPDRADLPATTESQKPVQPRKDGKQLNDGQTKVSKSNQSNLVAPYPNPSQPMTSYPNKSNSKKLDHNPNQPMASYPNQTSNSSMRGNTNPNQPPVTPYPNQNNTNLMTNPYLSQTKPSNSKSKNVSPTGSKSQTTKQMPNKKTKSKLMQPKYFSTSKDKTDESGADS